MLVVTIAQWRQNVSNAGHREQERHQRAHGHGGETKDVAARHSRAFLERGAGRKAESLPHVDCRCTDRSSRDRSTETKRELAFGQFQYSVYSANFHVLASGTEPSRKGGRLCAGEKLVLHNPRSSPLFEL
jgi:hypothetical protein